MLPVLILVTAFIVYGSLYPWQFHAATIHGNPLAILLHSWSLSLNRYLVKDTAVNVVLYIPFGTTCYLWLSTRAARLKVPGTLLLGLLLSSSIEMIQLFDAHRVCSMVDVVTNVTGTTVGMILATRFRSMVALRPGTGAPLFLLSCWIGAMLFPFMPDLSRYHLNYKLLNFTQPHFSALPFFTLFVMWLVAARLVEAAVDRLVTPLLLFILPARLFVEGITLSWTDALPAVLALLVFFVWPPETKYGSRPREAIMATLSIIAIVLTGLAPFHFADTTQSFSWIPFRALFSTDWQAGFAIFFRKSFTYGSTIWLLTESGIALIRSSWEIALMLAWLEVNQLWLPNHVAESTDPIHALVLAWILHRLKSPSQDRRIPKRRA